ncbi:MAG TPA: transposase [Polyangiaceae bacterium]|nr:transposase [Polyangiaceae bacterium]
MAVPPLWSPPVALDAAEEKLLPLCKKAPLFVFLRRVRLDLFDAPFQAQLNAMYKDSPRGQPPAPPALLAMASVLQAATGVSDAEAVRLSAADRCWQMVLGTLGSDEPPFCQATLCAFRARLMAHDLDRALLERSVAWARERGGYSYRRLRAAFDASPLWGCGRVEDTLNLIGHAARDVVRAAAAALGVPEGELARRAGIPLVAGTSLKATLDLDWNDAGALRAGLSALLGQVASLRAFVRAELGAASEGGPLGAALATLAEVVDQDVEPDPAGGARVRRGVAPERRISVTDGQMRHGRKSRASRVDGYKRHLAREATSRLALAAAVTPANRPEAEAAGALCEDIERQGLELGELDVDRGYVLAKAVTERRAAGLVVRCRALPLRNGGRFTKADFRLDFEAAEVTCPAGQRAPLAVGTVVRFGRARCAACPLRERCTGSAAGRTLSVHADEPFLASLRAAEATPGGRAELRERTQVEHGLARVQQTQGDRARYRGVRKNLLDLRRHATLHNLYIAMGLAA